MFRNADFSGRARFCNLLILFSIALVPGFSQTLTKIYDFGAAGSPQIPYGSSPESTLVEVSPDVFYGTAFFGGVNGCGTIFSITSTGQITKLHDFKASEGCHPFGKLAMSVDGLLYGVTSGVAFGGQVPTLFRSDLNGNVTLLEKFYNSKFSVYPQPPTVGADGSIYLSATLGTNFAGFTAAAGAVYRFGINDASFSVLGDPFAANQIVTPLILASDGNLYGGVTVITQTTSYNRIYQASSTGIKTIADVPYQALVALGQGGNGKLYVLGDSYLASLNLDGTDYVGVHAFCLTDCSMYTYPQTGFTLASDGSLYAGLRTPSPNQDAQIFKVTPAGKYETVYMGTQSIQTLESISGLAVQGSDGKLYGELIGSSPTATDYYGAIYSLDLGLPKPIRLY